ncbi:MAG: calcium-binding protein [Methylococcales bacterium]|nr:calcium-binding protein [Methylococcales bacterium]
MTDHTIAGAAASDTIIGFATGDIITVTAPYTTGGNLTISLADLGVSVDLTTVLGSSGVASITGGTGNDTITGGTGNNTIIGGSGDDAISGSFGNDTITGDDGNDNIDSGAGNDTIDGGNGDDSIYGGYGADSMMGGDGNDTITGGANNDDMSNDTLNGGNGDDSIIGGARNDSIIGGAGNDTLTGGLGNDTFLVDAGTDTITDWATGDTLTISAGATAKIAVTNFNTFISSLASIPFSMLGMPPISGVSTTNNSGTLVMDGSQTATVAQAKAIDDATTGALVFTAGLSDTIDNYYWTDHYNPMFGWYSGLATGVAALLATNPAVTITGNPVTIAQAKAIDDATTGTLTLTAGISDDAPNFFSDYSSSYGTTLAPGVASLLSTNPNVNVAFTPYYWASIAELKAIDDLTTGTVTPTRYTNGTAAEFVNDAATNGGAGTYVTSSTQYIQFTDSVTIAQLTAITQNYHNWISFNGGITDTADHLATHNGDGTWTVDPLISYYTPTVNVSGAIDPTEATALKNAGAWLLLDTSLSAPNTYVIETASTPDLVVTTNMVANVIDATGDQTIGIDQHGKLNLSGTVGHNVIRFGNYSAADDTWNDGQLEVSRSGGTVIFADHSTHEQIASIETNANAPSQTIKFGSGPNSGIELTFNGSTIALDGEDIPVIEEGILLVGTDLPTIDAWWNANA